MHIQRISSSGRRNDPLNVHVRKDHLTVCYPANCRYPRTKPNSLRTQRTSREWSFFLFDLDQPNFKRLTELRIYPRFSWDKWKVSDLATYMTAWRGDARVAHRLERSPSARGNYMMSFSDFGARSTLTLFLFKTVNLQVFKQFVPNNFVSDALVIMNLFILAFVVSV